MSQEMDRKRINEALLKQADEFKDTPKHVEVTHRNYTRIV